MARATGSGLLEALTGAWLAGLMCAAALPPGLASACGVVALGLGTACGALVLVRIEASQAGSGGRELAAVYAALVGACLAGASVGPGARVERWPPAGLCSLELDVLETQHDADGSSRALARVVRGRRLEDGAALEAGALLRVAPVQLHAGTRVRLAAQVSPTVALRNPSPHPDWPRARLIAGRAWVLDARAVQVVHADARALLERARAYVGQRLRATLPLRIAGIACAIVLGEGDAVDALDQAAIRDAGLSHVLAVSGMHVTLLVGLCVALLRALLVRCTPLAERFEARRIACALGAPLALLYAAFAGGAPSAWRAAVTAAIGWGLIALGRRPSAAAVTAFAVLVLGGLDPREALRPGFLLSVLSTAVIIAQPPPSPSLRGHASFALRIAVATTLATAPLVVWCFGAMPVVGVLANVVLVPFGSLALLPLASVHALLAASGFEATLTAHLLTLCSDAFLRGCGAFAALGPPWQLPPPDVAQGVALLVAAIALLKVRGVRGAVVVLLATVWVLGALELRLRHAEQPRGVLRATFLDVGQGDSALIDLPDGRLMLVDAGGNPGGGLDPGAAVLVPLLRARRREHIDIAVLTHPHPDHYGGLRALAERIPIRELWDSGQAEAERDLEAASGEAAALIAALRARGTRVRTPPDLCGHPLRAGRAVVRVLAPCPHYDSAHDANDNSLVLRIDHGAHGLLLMGDAERAEEESLIVSAQPLRADVLKVGHHGSRTSTQAALLDAVRPRIAIVSAGAANRFGHPHTDVMQRLHAAVPRVIELAKLGGTVITSDGTRLTERE